MELLYSCQNPFDLHYDQMVLIQVQFKQQQKKPVIIASETV